MITLRMTGVCSIGYIVTRSKAQLLCRSSLSSSSNLEPPYGRTQSLYMALYRIGMDLSKVTFPTFVLEPRSMLERITDFMSHPDLIFGSVIFPRHTCWSPDPHLPPRAENLEEPEERFIQILRYYLSGWHVKPKGVKKPCVMSMPLQASCMYG
jgi:oxysterol-binding protein-related protein 8